MSFNTALSGINAAQAELNVASNNIANVATYGFKESRAEFGDIYAASTFGRASTNIGSGVITQAVSQQFKQGNLEFTSNTLDFAVSGEGFFILTPTFTSSERIYTRAGAFGVDGDGFVVNNSGQYLQVFPVNDDGTVTSTALQSSTALQLPQSAGQPSASTEIIVGPNLPAGATALNPAGFDPTTSNTYNASTSLNVFDSLGQSHIATLYFVKDSTVAAGNSWEVFLYVSDTAGVSQPVLLNDGAGGTQASATVTFNNDGGVATVVPTVGGNPLSFTTTALGTAILGNGPDATQTITVSLDPDDTTQFSSPFSVNRLTQDGFSIGRLTGVDVDEGGLIRANYSNGQAQALGKIAIARFPSTQGLAQLGNNNWAETISSGEPLAGEAGTASFGLVRSGALETSNVDLTSELVRLITAQRNYQANAKSIETNNAVTQAIINIR